VKKKKEGQEMRKFHQVCSICVVAIISAFIYSCDTTQNRPIDPTFPSPSPSPSASATPPAQEDYLAGVREATYRNLTAMVDPVSGLPNDRFDASLFDVIPQLSMLRVIPILNGSAASTLTVDRLHKSINPEGVRSGDYGLRFAYSMSAATWESYVLESRNFDVSAAEYLDCWVKGTAGGERFEIVLWDDILGAYPGRPDSAMLTAGTTWERKRISLDDFAPYADMSSLERLSISFNDAMSASGTVYLDDIAFVDASGNRIPVRADEDTNVSNIGTYLASLVAASELGLETRAAAAAKADKALDSLIALSAFAYHGFLRTHNYIVSLQPAPGENRIISGVDSGNLAAGLMVVRQAFPQCAAKASGLLDAMQWNTFYDSAAGLPYGAQYPDGTVSSSWHYDWLAADSRLMHYIAIGSGGMPAASWNNLNQSMDTSRSVASEHFAPGWLGGGLFMAGLPAIFLDERDNPLGASTQNFVDDQIGYKGSLGAPAWGWSATVQPPFGETYCGYGFLNTAVIVPHASMLAAEYVDEGVLTANLKALAAVNARRAVTDGTVSYDYGFSACVEWGSARPVPVYLFIDQSMAFLGLANKKTGGKVRTYFNQDPIAQAANASIPIYAP
jgi:hypothetical protein